MERNTCVVILVNLAINTRSDFSLVKFFILLCSRGFCKNRFDFLQYDFHVIVA